MREVRRFLKRVREEEAYKVILEGCYDDVGIIGPTIWGVLRNLEEAKEAHELEDEEDITFAVTGKGVKELVEQIIGALEWAIEYAREEGEEPWEEFYTFSKTGKDFGIVVVHLNAYGVTSTECVIFEPIGERA